MLSSSNCIEESIVRARSDLNAWLINAYGDLDVRKYYGEKDCCYDKWSDVELLVGHAFDQGLVQQLSESSIASILFFISRSDERGRILAWLSTATGSTLSGCGNLTSPDFLFLCEQALIRDDDACDYQFAACFQKFESLDDRAAGLLLRFFHKRNSYTRRRALQVFAHFAHPQTASLAKILWKTDDCEFAKLSCLHALQKHPEAKDMFDEYLQEYQNTHDINAEEYRQSHLRQLTSNTAS